MPFYKLKFKPGIVRDQTNYSNEGGWFECDKVRFFSGYPQKIGGWVEGTSERFIGTCRQLWSWFTSLTDNLLAVGTNEKVYIEVGGYFYDITPIKSTTAAGDPKFLAVAGSSTIVVSDATFGSVAGDYVGFTAAATLGGNITAAVLNQNYKIVSVIDANSYTIEAKDPTTKLPVLASASDVTSSTFTATAAAPTVLTFASYTPTNNDRLYLYTTNTLPAGLSTGVVYYVVNAAGATCQLSLTQGGSALPATTTGTGTHTASLFKGGALTVAAYEIPVGFASPTLGYGWGTGSWDGSFGWGLASPIPVKLPQQDWWFDNIENNLVMNIRNQLISDKIYGGPIYYWERGTIANPTSALNTRAILLSSVSGAQDVPTRAYQVLLSQNDRHLLALGAQPYGGGINEFDPLLIRWASQDAPEFWTPGTVTVPSTGTLSSAGFLRVSRGSKIIRGLATRQEILVFTDTHLYSLQFLGTVDVFGLQEYSDNISIISPRAVTTANNVTFWMGTDKFYMYDGRVQTLPCTIREYIFKDINFAQADQIICGTNEGFNEIWWFYPSGNSNWIDRYAIYNHLEQVWYYGSMVRTAWLDAPLRDTPTATATLENSSVGTLYRHEIGLNDVNAPLVSYIQSSDFDISDGEQFMLTRRMIPDINFNTSTASQPELTLEIRPRNFPGATFAGDPSDQQRVIQTSFGVYTGQVFIRARARQLALKVYSDQLNVQWQLGDPRLDARPDGKR